LIPGVRKLTVPHCRQKKVSPVGSNNLECRLSVDWVNFTNCTDSLSENLPQNLGRAFILEVFQLGCFELEEALLPGLFAKGTFGVLF
jgi:hypothetical protein